MMSLLLQSVILLLEFCKSSVRCGLCNKTKELTANIQILYEKPLVFWNNSTKILAQTDPPLQKMTTFDGFCFNVITNRKLTTSIPVSLRQSIESTWLYLSLLPTKGWFRNRYAKKSVKYSMLQSYFVWKLLSSRVVENYLPTTHFGEGHLLQCKILGPLTRSFRILAVSACACYLWSDFWLWPKRITVILKVVSK